MPSLLWHHNERNGVSNHQPQDCLLKCLFWHRSKKTSKLCIAGLCEGNSPVTCEFPTQRACNVENVSIWWCHHVDITWSIPALWGRTWLQVSVNIVVEKQRSMVCQYIDHSLEMAVWNSSQTQISLKLICPQIISQLPNYFKMLHRAWLWYCHALCKFSKCNRNGCYGWTRFYEICI